MKPNFALQFTDTSIALLHRSGRGWTLLGETPFDAPDLGEALDYLRKTALGLEPGGFSTKLVIPNGQILFTEIEAPGPSDEERRAQILAALVARTGLAAEEIGFDWSGKGKVVKVAALDRQTLAEAEGFAQEHRFNPVSFVAIPDEGTFSGEPFFGPASAVPPGTTVDRDRSAIVVQAGRTAATAAPEAAALSAPAPAAAEPTPIAAPAAEPTHSAAAAPQEAPAAPPVEVPQPVPAAPQPDIPAEDPAPADLPPGDAPPEEGPPWDLPPEDAPPDVPIAASVPAPADDRAVPDFPWLRQTADDPLAATPFAPPPRDEVLPPAAPQPIGLAPATADAAPGSRGGLGEADFPAPAPLAARDGQRAEAPSPADDEAPFAEVPDSSLFPEDDLDPPAPGAAASAPRKGPPPVAADPDDDLPPMPAGAILAAFSSRRGAGEAPSAAAPAPGGAEGTPPALPAARRSAETARPDAAALARAARGKPIEDLPPMPRPPQAGGRPGSAAGSAKSMARGLGALAIPGSRKGAKGKPAVPAPSAAAAVAASAALPSAAASVAAPAPGEAARSLGRSPFAARPAPKRSPFVFLILVAILLLALAAVAAWSSFWLASGDDPAAAEVAATGPDEVPAIEDEMAADAVDPEALADGVGAEEALPPPGGDTADTAALPEAEAAGPEPAPDAALATDSPPAVVLVDQQDEIFLAAADAPPPALDALSLPPPAAGSEAPPGLPMPPPPPGTVYKFDANGLIVPMPDGIPSPAGFMLYAGRPDVVPPPRSAAAEAAAAAAAAATATVEAVPVTEAPSPGTAGDPAGNPSLVEALPVGAVPADPAAEPAAQPNPELADRRPRPRPEGLVPPADTADDDAALATEDATVVTSLRPRARPPTVIAAGERARSETAAASLAAPGAAASAEEEAVLAAANPSVLTISRRPAAKPKDFSRAVEAAVAAAVRAPEPEPEAEPAPEKVAKKAPDPDLKEDEAAEADEPEKVASAAPKIPSSANVAKQATFRNALNLSKINLIGVYGTQSKRYALIRQSNGKYKKVKVGDRIDGGRIEAITQSEVRYQKGGRLVTLKMPKG